MINQGTIIEESLIVLRFFFVGMFFAFIYYLFIATKRLLIRRSFSLKFKGKKINKVYKKCKNPIKIRESKFLRIKDKIMEFVLDILYFVIITPMMAIFLFGYNNGKARWYLYVAVLVGFIIYRIVLGKLSLFLIEHFAFEFLLMLSFCCFYIKSPLIKLKRIFKVKFKRKENKTKQNSRIIYTYGKSRR